MRCLQEVAEAVAGADAAGFGRKFRKLRLVSKSKLIKLADRRHGDAATHQSAALRCFREVATAESGAAAEAAAASLQLALLCDDILQVQTC